MSRWAIFVLLLLNSCTVLKEKSRLKRDSLSLISTSEQWELKQQWQNSAYLFKDSNSLQAVLIKANAPFRWQADSGLSGKAGNYQLYLLHRGKVLRTESQSGKQDLAVKQKQERREAHRSMKEDKGLTAAGTSAGLIAGLALLLVVGLVIGRRCLLKWV
jgi:hypothetical protein